MDTNIRLKAVKPRMRPVNNVHHGRVWVCHGRDISAIDKTGTDAFGAWKRAVANQSVADLREKLVAGTLVQQDVPAMRVAIAHLQQEAARPCRSPYCECEMGQCTHPGCYDARHLPVVTAEMVQALRAKTDEPMMACKRALTANGGDAEKAEEWLRLGKHLR